jgi:PAS domain S-box-containing protein
MSSLIDKQLLHDYHHLINSMHNVFLAVDKKGIVISFNKSAARVFDYPQEKAVGRPISDVNPGTGLLKVVQTGIPHIGRKFKVGSSVFIANRTPIFINNKVEGAIGVAQDITELESLSDELSSVQEIKGTLETILESAYDGIIVVNSEGYITMSNKSFRDLFNLGKDIIGKFIPDVVKGSRLHLVTKHGLPEISQLVRYEGKELIVTRLPIKKDGKVIGAVAKVLFSDVNQLISLAEKVTALRSELDYYKDEVRRYREAKFSCNSILGSSKVIEDLKAAITRVAKSSSTVLIRGESGTGKELFAHALHAHSNRQFSPFIKVNCAAIPENLLESELFGYAEGAFTGAKKGGQLGKFQLANNGTIFLDEIGDMPLPMQVKLLRVLQEKEIERLGDGKVEKINVRIVAATNRDLTELIEQKLFREDLFFRLNVVVLQIPPLRERLSDLPLLVEHFINRFNQEFYYEVKGLTPDAWRILKSFDWPGNVRELENVIERAFNMMSGLLITSQDLPSYLNKSKQPALAPLPEQVSRNTIVPLPDILAKVEQEAIQNALRICEGNKKKAAEKLGVSRSWLYRNIEK